MNTSSISLLKSLSLLLCLSLSFGLAQDVKRVVVLPFNASQSFEPYGLGLATGLQRSLNVVDGVYVPPVGDAFLFTNNLVRNEDFSVNDIAAAFNSDVVVSGQVSGEGSTAEVLLNFAGPSYPTLENVTVNVNAENPQDVVSQVVNAVVSELELGVNATDREELTALAAQTPSVPSLLSAAEAALRLPGIDPNALATTAELDPGSSWVQSEYARALALDSDLEAAAAAAASAVAAAPSDVEAQVVQGVILQTQGDAEGATAAFDRALALNPVHAPALVGKAGVTQDAALLESAIGSYPRYVEAYLELANLEAQDSPQAALQTLRRGTSAVPEASSLHSAFIRTALELGDAAGALAYLQETIAAQDNPPPTLYSLAALLPADLQNEALAVLNEGQAAYPGSVTISLATARLLQSQDDAPGAISTLQSALENNEGNEELTNALAVLQAQEGDVEAAQATLESLGTSGEDVQFNLAQLYLEAGDNEAALGILEPLASERPDDAEVQANYGIALGRLGRYEEALAALETALSLNPELSEAAEARSLLQQEQQITGAGERVQVELSSEAASAFAEGQTAFAAEDYETALAAFERARTAQDEGLIAFYQGLTYYVTGQSRQAVEPYQRALEAFPESDVVLNNAGLTQLDLGRFDLALDLLERATTANPDNAEAQLNLGLAYYELERFADAVTRWEEAVRLNPEFEASIATALGNARERSGQ